MDRLISVSCIRHGALDAHAQLVYAPGAGSNLNDPFGTFLGGYLPSHGISVVRFQFPYMEQGGRSPDRAAVLQETWRKVIQAVSRPGLTMVVGGRSMGGRIASVVVAEGTATADGLALFSYPLHPLGLPDQRRDAHLKDIAIPAFFCSGTRDAYGSPDELRRAVEPMPQATLHLLEGADHSFSVLRSSRHSKTAVWQEAVQAFARWLEMKLASVPVDRS